MSRRDAVILLADILEAAQRAARYARRYASFADFVSNTETVDAITRNLEIVGEASRMLPEDFKEEHREIPWRTLSGLRNRIAHEYFGIDESVIWQIARHELEPLIRDISAILSTEKSKET
ncbi:MAG: DUF86 domain-containing protein [Candidatus Cryosericum sp.]